VIQVWPLVVVVSADSVEFGRVFFFLLVVCILDVSTSFRHYDIAEL
jgi:hypothetical protein